MLNPLFLSWEYARRAYVEEMGRSSCLRGAWNSKRFDSHVEGMSIGIFSCSTLSQAKEVLSSQRIELVFCDEHLSDGSFRDLLREYEAWIGTPHIVVIVSLREWPEYPEALQPGDFEVITSPLHPTDVELAVIRAMRGEGRESFFQVSA